MGNLLAGVSHRQRATAHSCSIRDKPYLVVDEQMGERLVRNKRRVVEVLQGSANCGELLQAVAVLALATLRTVVARFRRLKRVQEEATSLVYTVDALTLRCDQLAASSGDLCSRPRDAS